MTRTTGARGPIVPAAAAALEPAKHGPSHLGLRRRTTTWTSPPG